MTALVTLEHIHHLGVTFAQNEWIDGVKTGHTADSGYVLVASGHRDGMTLISAVLGTDSEHSAARGWRRLGTSPLTASLVARPPATSIRGGLLVTALAGFGVRRAGRRTKRESDGPRRELEVP